MNLTHCKHNVPRETECLECESDAANNAGAGIPPSMCACGETAAPFPYPHGRSQCMVSNVWVDAAAFVASTRTLIEKALKAAGETDAAREEVGRLVQVADEYRLRAEKAEREGNEWRNAACSLARVIGHYSETGRIE